MSKMGAYFQEVQDRFIYLDNLVFSLDKKIKDLKKIGQCSSVMLVEYAQASNELKELNKKHSAINPIGDYQHDSYDPY